MSEKPKIVDTSMRVVKNPLLSASVTGLTFDEFHNKPLLLPAAPIRESKSLVTVGNTSDIDSENLDEINLNATTEESQPATIDTNANPLLEQHSANTDSILSQAASSFSALPSVASNVFSTFSKRIYAGSTSRERTPGADEVNANSISQLDIQPTYTQHQQHLPTLGQTHTAIPPPFYAPPPGYFGGASIAAPTSLGQEPTPPINAPPAEPPKFYTPADVATLPSVGPPPSTAPNTYRLSAKKKIYAPIPGFSDPSQLHSTPTVDPAAVSAPLAFDNSQTNPYGFTQPDAFSQQPSYLQQPKGEERKSGIFSLTNLVPTGVLQNLSGLVQSAAGTLTQSAKSEPSQQNPNIYTQPQVQGAFNDNLYGSINPQQQQQQTEPVNFFAPPPSVGTLPPQNWSTGHTLSVGLQQQEASVVPPVGIGPPPSALLLPTASQTVLQPPPSASFIAATPIQTQFQSVPGSAPQVIACSAQISSPSDLFESSFPPSSGIPVIGQQTTAGLFNPQPDIPLFAPSASPYIAESTNRPLPIQSFGVPPTIGSSQPPPVSGQTSFRLQKGTRLYKNPLTSAETAPAYASQLLGQPQPPTQLPQAVFNPFAPTNIEQSSSSNLAEAPVSNFFVPTTNTPEPQSVPLFAAPETKPTINPPTGVIGFINTAENLTQEPQRTLSFSPEEIKPSESLQQGSPDILTSSVDLPKQSTLSISSEPQSVDLFAITKEVDPNESPALLTAIEPVVNVETPQPIAAITEPCIQDHTIEPILLETVAAAVIDSADQTSLAKTEEIDPLEQTLQKLSLEPEIKTNQAANFLPPPPHNSTIHGQSNPYRKGLTGTHPIVATAPAPIAPPSLSNFFTPTSSDTTTAGGGDFNFFGIKPNLPESVKTTPPPASSFFDAPVQSAQQTVTNVAAANFFNSPQEIDTIANKNILDQPLNTVPEAVFPALPTFSDILQPPPLVQEEPVLELTGIAPPLGFDNLVLETRAATAGQLLQDYPTQPEPVTESSSSLNSFSNYFNQTLSFPKQEQQKLPDPSTFFDSFAPQPLSTAYDTATAPPAVEVNEALPSKQQQKQTNEDQRIQNFFNNPPPKENGGGIGDLNYDLVHSGLGVKDLQIRSSTPASNLVEPPSSSCSEFSELNTSTAAQKVIIEHVIKEESAVKNTNATSPTKTIAPPAEEATPSGVQTKHYEELPEEILHALRMANLLTSEKGAAAVTPAITVSYTPAVKHWFFKRPLGAKYVWLPFSHYDSALLETSSIADGDDIPNIVAVEGGRYDVNIRERTKVPVYWDGEPIEVRRCSWFYKAIDSKYVPYEEEIADLLEAEYKMAAESGSWHKKIILSRGEQVVFHGPTVIVHFQQQPNNDAWGGTSQATSRPRVVKRDLDDFTIEQGESQRVDHLLFMVHGIGSACDLKMRTVEEVVDEFRSIAQQLVQSHYKNSTDMGIVGRVEVLPISWHSHLHSQEMGIDEKLKSITLESIPKLRNFTNDTLLDVLFYTSPTFCQKIMNTVAASMNALYLKYRERQPDFSGGVSLAGHSLGSLILFDLLCHQKPLKECEDQNMENPDQLNSPALDSNLATASNDEISAKQISYTMGPAGTGQPFIHYAQLIFPPKKFFALGSPIGMFVTIRGIDKLGLDFRLPTCPGFYNIFHPFDPVAYRIEALVNPDMSGIRPVLIPHHKGRKRMHLELKETMTRVGADLKQRFVDTFKTTMESVNFLGVASRSKKDTEETMEKEVDKVIQMQMQLEQQQQQENLAQISPTHSHSRTRADSTSTTLSDSDMIEVDFPLGKLNDSKRVDYVLQEAPLEFFNEYLFALSSHVCYWESEDTILFVMKEIYSGLGISPDSQVPQQTMTIERPNSRNSVSQSLLPPST